jgi:DNA-directed RNA polymerase specialized sigma24 family protein
LFRANIMSASESGCLRDLIDRCRADDEVAWEAFCAWYHRLADNRLKYSVPRMRESDRAEVTSAALERLLRAIKQNRIYGTTDGEIASYVAAAVKNQARDILSRRRPLEAPAGGDGNPSPERVAIGRDLLDRVERAIGSWAADDRYIFVQKIHGVSSARIKAELEEPPYGRYIDVATVDSRYSRLRQELRLMLGEPTAGSRSAQWMGSTTSSPSS